jgi:hypothetical protein
MSIRVHRYQKPRGEKEWEEYREMAQAFSTWACEKLIRIEAENESLRIDLRWAQRPCDCEEQRTET